MRRAAKVDSNQAAIVEALRKRGYTVGITSAVGKGFPDLVIGGHGANVLVECKRPGEKLNKEQSRFHSFWRGPIVVVHSADEALKALRLETFQ